MKVDEKSFPGPLQSRGADQKTVLDCGKESWQFLAKVDRRLCMAPFICGNISAKSSLKIPIDSLQALVNTSRNRVGRATEMRSILPENPSTPGRTPAMYCEVWTYFLHGFAILT